MHLPERSAFRRLFAAFALLLTTIPSGQLLAQEGGVDPSPPDTANEVRQNEEIPQDKHVYRMNYWFSVPFSIAASAANVYAIPNVIKAKPGITDAELAGLNPEKYNFIDRWALEQDPSRRDQNYKNSDILLPAIIASVGALGFDNQIRKDWLRIFTMYFETHAVTFSLYNFSFFGPAFQNKLRPYVYYDYFPASERQTGNQRNSLYSGHTASASAAAFFAVKVYSDYHPEIGNKKYLYYGLASVPALLEGYLRMKALAHFPSDIMVGFAIGAVCGVVVPDLHKFRHKTIKLGLNYNQAGPGMYLTWRPDYETKKIPRAFAFDKKVGL
ncbi:MAG: phosphatase PAP2 family protein [Sphingobacteriales bacterium]|nr:MAG: phosphatase PAP2 family protein [Sphingobacteriales bacterium]